MNGWDFDGEHEIRVGLEERGRSFQLSTDQYGALAQVAMGALRLAGVEPSMIRLLPSGEPGADVVLYGKNWVYTLRMEPMKRRSALYGQQLDSKLGGPGVELCVHEFRDTNYVGAILTHILAHEGIPLMSFEELQEWHKRQDFYPRNDP
jgi:hypothetical protein